MRNTAKNPRVGELPPRILDILVEDKARKYGIQGDYAREIVTTRITTAALVAKYRKEWEICKKENPSDN